MKIGLTGATGLIGNAVAQLAEAHGHEIIAFSRKPQLANLKWDTRRIDTASAKPLDPTGLDCLIHLAGESIMGLWTNSKMRSIRDSRVETTKRIAQCINDSSAPPKTFICASGSGFYGDRGDQWLTEESTPGSDFLAQVCIDWEGAAKAAQQRVVLLRTGLVLAKHGGAFPLMKKAFSFNLGGRLGSGRQYMPWIHLEDEARIILWAAENQSIQGPINLAAPEAVTNAEFTCALAKSLHRLALLPAPAFAMRLALGGLADVVLASQRVKPEVAQNAGFEFKFPTLSSALTALA